MTYLVVCYHFGGYITVYSHLLEVITVLSDFPGFSGNSTRTQRVKEDSVLEPSLAKITLRIPGLDSGTSDEDAGSGAEAELQNTSLQACKMRKKAAAHLSGEIKQSRVDFKSPPISPDNDRDKAIGVVDVQAEIAAAVDLIELQKQDAILGVIRAWLESADVIPDKNTLCTFEPEVQQLWAQKESLEITRGILYRRYVRPDGSLLYLQIVVPQVLRTAFLDAVHAGAISGHPGIERARERLQEIAYWKGWTEDVYAYVQRCPVCATHRQVLERSKAKCSRRWRAM